MCVSQCPSATCSQTLCAGTCQGALVTVSLLPVSGPHWRARAVRSWSGAVCRHLTPKDAQASCTAPRSLLRAQQLQSQGSQGLAWHLHDLALEAGPRPCPAPRPGLGKGRGAGVHCAGAGGVTK